MYRVLPPFCLCLILSTSTILSPAADEKEPSQKKLTAEEFKKAITDLGGKNFATREKAKKQLTDAGAAAEPFLEEAVNNPDNEIANSAKSILEPLKLGIYPDTPKEVREQIQLFLAGDQKERLQAVGKLLQMNPIPFETVYRLSHGVAAEDTYLREKIADAINERVEALIPDLLLRGELTAAEELFERVLFCQNSWLTRDYAALMYFQNRLDAAIERFEKRRCQKGEAGQRAAKVLVYLYRNKGDWTAARNAAADSKKSGLIEDVLCQASDWKALAVTPHDKSQTCVEGLEAACHRLAGNQKGFDEKIAVVKRIAEESADQEAVYAAVSALLLNGKLNDAVKVLIGRKKEPQIAFELLCAQLKFKEAFELADAASLRDNDSDERYEIDSRRKLIDIRRAQMLYQLGERDAAVRLFSELGDSARPESEFFAGSLIKTEVSMGLRELACDHAARLIAQLRAAGLHSYRTQKLIRPFFENADVARCWISVFHRERPDETPAVAIKRATDILAGKLGKKELDVWIAIMLENPPSETDFAKPQYLPASAELRMRTYALEAIAAAYKGVANDSKTEEYLRRAAEQSPTDERLKALRWMALGDFQMDKKKYREAVLSFANAAKFSLPPGYDHYGYSDSQTACGMGKARYGPALPTFFQSRAATLAGDVKEGKRLNELAHLLSLSSFNDREHVIEELNIRDWADMNRREADFMRATGWDDCNIFVSHQSAREKDFFKAAEYGEKNLVRSLRFGGYVSEYSDYFVLPERIRLLRARGYLAKGEVAKAIQEANASLEVVPGNIEVATKLVPALDKLGKKQEADALYAEVLGAWQQVCKDYPKSAFAHDSAARIMVHCRRDLDDGLKHAQKAVDGEPKNASYLETLAEVHFQKGDRVKAISLIKKCMELDPKNLHYRKQLARFKDQPIDSLPADTD